MPTQSIPLACPHCVGGNAPQDCDWPCCGCDPHAEKVIEALSEQGKLK